MWKRGEIAPSSSFPHYFVLLSEFHVKTGTRFSLRDKRYFEISEFEITRFENMFNFGFVGGQFCT